MMRGRLKFIMMMRHLKIGETSATILLLAS